MAARDEPGLLSAPSGVVSSGPGGGSCRMPLGGGVSAGSWSAAVGIAVPSWWAAVQMIWLVSARSGAMFSVERESAPWWCGTLAVSAARAASASGMAPSSSNTLRTGTKRCEARYSPNRVTLRCRTRAAERTRASGAPPRWQRSFQSRANPSRSISRTAPSTDRRTSRPPLGSTPAGLGIPATPTDPHQRRGQPRRHRRNGRQMRTQLRTRCKTWLGNR